MVAYPGPIDTEMIRNFQHDDQSKIEKLAKLNAKMSPLKVNEVAGIIISAIKKKKHRVVISWQSKMMDKIARLFPSLYYAIIPARFRPSIKLLKPKTRSSSLPEVIHKEKETPVL